MAHHNSTPETVLKAPKLTPEWLVEHTGHNRHWRRHVVVRGPRTGDPVRLPRPRKTIPRRLRVPATNVPYRKPKEAT